MSPVKPKAEVSYVSPTTQVLLTELGEECQRVLKLLVQLELAGLRATQVEDVLGELSAAVLHLHEHTRGLDAIIDGDLGGP
jgi:hypothetical protein